MQRIVNVGDLGHLLLSLGQLAVEFAGRLIARRYAGMPLIELG